MDGEDVIKKSWEWIPILLMALAGTGCQPEVHPERVSTNTPRPTSTPTITPTSAPRLRYELQELMLLPGDQPLDWIVAGFWENRSPFAVQGVVLEVRLLGEGDDLLAQGRMPLPHQHLKPGEASPFSHAFLDAGTALEVEIDVVEYMQSDFRRGLLAFTELDRLPTEEGGVLVAYRGFNRHSLSAQVDSLAGALRDEEGELVGVVELYGGPGVLGPVETAVYTLLLPAGYGGAQLELCPDILFPENPLQPLALVLENLQVRFTDQEAVFVLGEVVNEGYLPIRPRLVIDVYMRERWVGQQELFLPVPVEPDERFVVQAEMFPGTSLLLQELEWDREDLEVRALVDPVGTVIGEEGVTLDLQATGYEVIGSRLYLRGIVGNPTESSVDSPHVLAVIRSTRGQILSAGWEEIRDRLAPGGSAEFTLSLPLPVGAEVTMAEFDLRAVGIRGSE